jgi:filamentous hemagglutinin
MGGLAAEAAGGDFRIGALSAGVNEAVVGLLADQYTKMPEEERKRLLVMNSQLVGVLTAAAAGGDGKDLQTGSWVAGSATSYNRLLHDAEKKALTTEAAELEKRLGKPGTDLSWDDLLLLAANAQVDEAENKRLQALLQVYDPQQPEGQHFAESLLIAQQSISRLAAQDIVLIWKEDRPIMADGDEVKAFQSSAKQFQDHGLFNADSKWTQASGNGWAGDVDLVPEAWKQQFGEKTAAIYLRKIGQVSSSPEQMNDLVERITVIAKGGVKDVTLDLDIALAMTGAPAVLRALLAKRVSAAMAETGGSLAGKEGAGSGGLAESSVNFGAKATGGANQTAGSIKNVNLGYPEAGRTHNCVNCSIATDATLAGNPASALPINHTKGVPLSVLEKQFGSKFGPVTAPENIAQQMANSGNGARGIVFGSYGPGQPGHVFNVVNQNGVVRFLDGQTGKSASLGDFKTLQLLRTN